jgi:signal transduction histidine kinase
MTILPRRTIASIALIASLILILAVLAVMQYRWSGQISEADKERMRAALLGSTNQFRLQFNNELQQLSLLFQPGAAILMQRDWKSYAESCSAALSSPGMHFVNNIYIWIASNDGDSRLLRLNRDSKDFELIAWPPRLENVKERHAVSFLSPPRPAFGFRPYARTMIYRVPILLEPLIIFRPPDVSGKESGFIGFLMIELNKESIKSILLPEISRSAFRNPEAYHVAVVNEFSGAIIYRSDPGLNLEAFAQPDARIRLIEDFRERPGSRTPGRGMGPPGPSAGRPPEMPFNAEPPPRPDRSNRGIAPISVEADGEEWVLVAKHREGSLDAAVARMRRRNLAISFGSLLLLAASMALIVSAARRAQRLARLQMEFVAGISHELRTPLAVICSAGDNLADGVIADSSQSAKRYGELIRSEGRKLSTMIERILQFAGLQRKERRYNLCPVQINEIADAALRESEAMIAAAGFSLEKDFAPGLHPVNADAAALSQAILNLIQNALKYSGENRWLAVRTREAAGKGGLEVQLIIEDKGIGIDSEDLPHIFEPFYRGRMALAEQIHGAGLGLYIVRETLVSMGASISAKSVTGKWSMFTMHFSALPAS